MSVGINFLKAVLNKCLRDAKSTNNLELQEFLETMLEIVDYIEELRLNSIDKPVLNPNRVMDKRQTK